MRLGLGGSRRAWGCALALIAVCLLLVGGAPSRAAVPVVTTTPTTPTPTLDPASARYFPETGFWVDPLFLDYWERNGGLMTFGYPITRDFYQDGLHRQYFERAIFEHHENETGDWRVQIVRLGAGRSEVGDLRAGRRNPLRRECERVERGDDQAFLARGAAAAGRRERGTEDGAKENGSRKHAHERTRYMRIGIINAGCLPGPTMR